MSPNTKIEFQMRADQFRKKCSKLRLLGKEKELGIFPSSFYFFIIQLIKIYPSSILISFFIEDLELNRNVRRAGASTCCITNLIG